MLIDVKDYAESSLRGARDRYIQDLEALTADQLDASPGGSARSPYDFTYEVVIVNRRFVNRLRGETPPPWPEGWIVAPSEFRDKATAIAELRASVDEIFAEVDPVPAAEYDRAVPVSDGSMTTFALVCFVANHIMYHGAQLNYVQALLGDESMHW